MYSSSDIPRDRLLRAEKVLMCFEAPPVSRDRCLTREQFDAEMLSSSACMEGTKLAMVDMDVFPGRLLSMQCSSLNSTMGLIASLKQGRRYSVLLMGTAGRVPIPLPLLLLLPIISKLTGCEGGTLGDGFSGQVSSSLWARLTIRLSRSARAWLRFLLRAISAARMLGSWDMKPSSTEPVPFRRASELELDDRLRVLGR